MRDLIILGAGSVVLYQASEIVQDSKVFVNNVFLCCSSVVCCQDMKLFRALGYLQHKLKNSYCSLSCCRGTFQELHRCLAFQKCFVFFRQHKIHAAHYPPPLICLIKLSSFDFSSSIPLS